MTTKNTDCSSQALGQGENAGPAQNVLNSNQVFKSGPLFISSKGIGWTSWKKRWFILTRTSLVFFRSDPSAAPQKGGEMNLTLGGIDLNNSASVEVKADKKLLTMFFPDGRDGRALTLKAETLDDLYEWKTALESALAQAPNATHTMGQNGVLKNEQTGVANGSSDQQKDKSSVKSMVIGRPILLALEDVDGSPSFLEKALTFIENYGVKVEGILRQAADVELVHRRVREYEQGKTEFSPDEDAHVIADCIKYILRELPSSPVPASCCTALLQAFRTDRNNRLNAMRTAILETFPEPNRRLLQRILMMMQEVASHKAENRMSISAVAACMSPLLLRPLLSGECELENAHMDVAGDGSLQLLQAAAAANHAQAIIIILLEEYNNIFGEHSVTPELFSNSDESGSETEEASDDDMYDDEEYDDDEDYDNEGRSDEDNTETDGEYEHSVAETSSGKGESDSYDDQQSERSSSYSKSPERVDDHLANQRCPRTTRHDDNVQSTRDTMKHKKESSVAEVGDSGEEKSSIIESSGSLQVRNPRWGRTPAKRNPSMESIEFSLEEEEEIERLEAAKIELQNRVAEEADANAKLKASLERRKKALHERRLALEKDVARLQEQLQKERDIRAALEAEKSSSHVPVSASFDEKVDVEEIAIAEENFNSLKQRLDDLGTELNHQIQQNATLMQDRQINTEYATKDASLYVERSGAIEGQRNYHMDGADHDNDRKIEASSLSNKNQNQSNDPLRGGSSKFGWLPGSSSLEGSMPKHTASTSRKSSKGEASNNAPSALSKLTTRLNFLKERRNQIASELQNIDKSRGSSGNVIQNPEGRAPEPTAHNVEKPQGPKSDHDDLTHQPSYSQGNVHRS